MMTAQTLLSTSMTLITSTENVTNNVLNDESKVRCSTLRNSASIEAMQNFFRFAPSISEFEEVAEEEDVFFSNDNSSLDINVLQQQLGHQVEEAEFNDNSRTLPWPDSSGMFCPTEEKTEELTLPWDETMKYEEAQNTNMGDDTLPLNHMIGGFDNKRKREAEDQSNNNSKSKQRKSS